MEKDLIIQNNKLIAEFMGAKYRKHPMKHLGNENEYLFEQPPCKYFSMTQFSEDRLYYHIYWDWLMPVVEKIESLGYLFFISDLKIEIANKKEYPNKSKNYFVPGTKLNAVFTACVEFIKWYNQK